MNEPDALGAERVRETIGMRRFARLKRRAEFQRVGRGRRTQAPSFTLQANRRAESLGFARFGLTITKKVGNAVERNRIRRRLREALRLTVGLETRPDHDYVLMARRETLGRRFEALQADMRRAFSQASAAGAKADRGSARRPVQDNRDKPQ